MVNWKVMGKIVGVFVVVSFLVYVGFQSRENTLTGKVISDTEYKENIKSIEEPKDTIIFSFSIYPTGEILNGEVVADEKSFGFTDNGELKISKEELLDLKEFEFRLTYNNYPHKFTFNFPSENLEYGYTYFEIEKYLLVEHFPEDFKAFIKPEEAKPYLDKFGGSAYEFEGDILEDLKKINSYTSRIRYTEDKKLYGQNDYWATPKETLGIEKGDCEDWAIAFVSLARAYKSDIKCYALALSTHMTTFCYIDNGGNGDYIIFDQGKIWLISRVYKKDSEQDKKREIRKLINYHFENYGLPTYDREIYFAFNDKEEIWFNNNEEFISWAYSFLS